MPVTLSNTRFTNQRRSTLFYSKLTPADSQRVTSALLLLVIAVLSTAMGWPSSAHADWSMYRGDAERSAHTTDALPTELSLDWAYHAQQPLQPAWPRSPRMQFDHSMPLAVAHGRVVFGHSATGQVVGLDLATGQPAWQVVTDGPVRFAPAVWKNLAFVASDDGYLYALRLDNGDLAWKRRGGPNEECVLGNEAMISKWPARGGPVVADDIVYFAAGIWPSENIYVYALEAETGEPIWCNSEAGSLYMPQPHGGANATSGISAQGHLLVCGERLLVPTGRAVPAALKRDTGELDYFHLQKYGHNGETSTLASDGAFINSGIAFDAETGHALVKLGSGRFAATEDGVLRAHRGTLTRFVWSTERKVDRRGNIQEVRLLKPSWTVKDLPEAATLAVAGGHAVLGCSDKICSFDLSSRAVSREWPVSGIVYSVAITDGKLLASTDAGHVYCFGSSGTEASPSPAITTAQTVTEVPAASPSVFAAAKEILSKTGVGSGYCLDLGCGDGQLALALATQSQLKIIAVDSDRQMVEQARAMLLAAGVYGNRVTVLCRDESDTGFPRYFADLIVSGRALSAGSTSFSDQEAQRLQRPYGGVICTGPINDLQIRERGPLEGAGSWTHQYADPANTACSGDQLVRGRLGMLWFRDIDFDIPSRHGRAPAPLFHLGRLFHEGMDGLVVVNAYNGHELWRYKIPDLLKAYDGDELMGTAGTGSNFCVNDASVFVRDGNRCLELDAASGQLIREYRTPADENGERSPWGYIAWSDGLLFGSTANAEHIVTYRYLKTTGDMTRLLTESTSLFAIDTSSGKQVWQYQATDSIRHNAIAIAGGQVTLIDRPLAEFDRTKKPKQKNHATGRLVALDANTGEIRWKDDNEIFGTLLAAQESQDVVLMSYQPTRFRLDSEFGGRMAAFRLSTGERIWDIKAEYSSRPMINGRTIYVQGGAWDLLTGEPVPFEFKRSYGCGILASSQHMLLFRSATLGYYDLSGAQETVDYGGIRPGCWINALPAGGVVLLPDATAGCQCSYLNKAWIGLEPR